MNDATMTKRRHLKCKLEDPTSEGQRRSARSRRGVGSKGHNGQGSRCTRKDDEKQSQRAGRLPGHGDAAVFADTIAYVVPYWFSTQLKRDCRAPDRGQFFRLMFRLLWLPCDGTFECVLSMVYNSSGGFTTRREGAE